MKDRKIVSVFVCVREREEEMERWRRIKGQKLFLQRPTTDQQNATSVWVFLTFAAQFSESERSVYTQGFAQGFVCSIAKKMIGKNIGALARNVRTFLGLKKPSQLYINCMNKIYILKKRCHVLFEM